MLSSPARGAAGASESRVPNSIKVSTGLKFVMLSKDGAFLEVVSW